MQDKTYYKHTYFPASKLNDLSTKRLRQTDTGSIPIQWCSFVTHWIQNTKKHHNTRRSTNSWQFSINNGTKPKLCAKLVKLVTRYTCLKKGAFFKLTSTNSEIFFFWYALSERGLVSLLRFCSFNFKELLRSLPHLKINEIE